MPSCSWKFPDRAAVKDIAAIVQSVVTIIAIVVGGGWALWNFGLKRVSNPKVVIDHEITSMRLTPDYRWIHLSVIHENKGETLVSLGSADIRLQRILPLPEKIMESITSRVNPAKQDRAVILWPLLCRLIHESTAELEPNERHEVTFEFLIPAYVKVLKIYSHFPNSEKSEGGNNIGWSKTTILTVPSDEESSNERAFGTPRSDAPFICAGDS